MRRLLTVLTFLLLAGCSTTPASDYARAVGAAARSGTPTPMLASFGLGDEVSSAYGLQRRVVGEVGGVPVGFKAGLTSSASQARFGADGPVAGVLLLEPLDTPELSSAGYATLMIELELAFRLSADVDTPVDEVSVGEFIDCVSPALEFPDLGYVDMPNLTVADIVASNVAARRFWVGDTCAAFAGIDALPVSLRQDHVILTEGTAADALGAQARALAWLVNHTLAEGYALRRGAWLITGALGAMVPGRPGTYLADFGALGTTRIDITTSDN